MKEIEYEVIELIAVSYSLLLFMLYSLLGVAIWIAVDVPYSNFFILFNLAIFVVFGFINRKVTEDIEKLKKSVIDYEGEWDEVRVL